MVAQLAPTPVPVVLLEAFGSEASDRAVRPPHQPLLPRPAR